MATQPKVDVTVMHGVPRTGLWCPKCMLPTGYEAEVFVLDESGVSVIGTAIGCTEDEDGDHYPS